MINTVKDLKEIIQNLPDDMLVRVYNGGNGDLHQFDHWILSKDELTEEEIKGYGGREIISTLVLSID